jgi:ribonuclease P protein component
MAARSSRPEGLSAPHGALPALDRLRIRPDFLRAARGIRRSAAGLTLEFCSTPETAVRPGHIRVGFTASRKVGNAVARNRAKRRLREAAAALLPLYGRPGNDYVLVARTATLTRPYGALLDDLKSALSAAHARAESETKAKA